jgi:MFS family permease
MTAVAPAPDLSPIHSVASPLSDATTSAPRTGRYLAAQVVGAFGQSAGVSAGLLADHMSGSAALAVVPAGVLALGGAMAGPVLTAVMSRRGRSAGLLVGYAAAVGGALVSLLAAAAGSLWLLVVATALFGSGNSAVMLTRYVLADTVPAHERGRAISRSLLATTAGAIVGPNLLGPAGHVGVWLGLPDAAGLYLMAVVAFALAALWLRPGVAPLDLRAAAPTSTGSPSPFDPMHDTAPPADERGHPSRQRLALVVLSMANASMVSLMALAGVQLHHHGHDLDAIGLVVSLHVAGMFVGSPVVGRLCDRLGALPVSLAGAVLLGVVGGLGVAVADGGIVAVSAVLLLLGVAWNVQVVAGSVLLTDGLPLHRRPAAEGRGELAMGLAAGMGTILGASSLTALGGFRLLSGTVAAIGLATAARLRATLRSTRARGRAAS